MGVFVPKRHFFLPLLLLGCGDASLGLGDACSGHSECGINLCAQVCVAPDGDLDGDGLLNAQEHSLGTKIEHPDTDGDGLQDGYEAGEDPDEPRDSDADGVADVLESNIADPDKDCLVDALDPNNHEYTTDPVVLVNALCPRQGVCAELEAVQSVECQNGKAQCSTEHPAYQPSEDRCDGLDNDCDGITDEGQAWQNQPLAGPCQGVGTCGTGVVECSDDGEARCSTNPGGSQNQTAAELCNGLDDDCDGQIDNELRLYGLTDGPMLGEPCAGTGVCLNGIVECEQGDGGQVICSTDPGGSHHVATTEMCNGLDDNCDGAVDEGFYLATEEAQLAIGETCGDGVCANGTVVCDTAGIHAICDSHSLLSAETCNNIDDDCDGETDENKDLDETLSGCPHLGLCSQPDVVTPTCSDGEWECIINENYAYEAGSEVSCDGIDNNCNGQTDESFVWVDALTGSEEALPIGASCGTGDCLGGTVVCSADAKGALCSSVPTDASAEICDSLDNDCDGVTDDEQLYNELALGSPCDGVGDCGDGVVVCSPTDMVATCSTNSNGTTPETTPEDCNQVDDDCDGLTDEAADLVITPLTCAAPGICQQGAGTPSGCVDGIWLCDLGAIPGYEAGNEVSCDGKDNDCDGLIDEQLPSEPGIAWMELHPGTPPPRSEMTAAIDPTTQQIIVVSGASVASKPLTDVWAYRWKETPRWKRLKASAPPRSGASLTYAPSLHAMHRFGGLDSNGKTTNGLWTLSLSDMTGSSVTVPAVVGARANHAAVVNPNNGWLWILGGEPTGIGSSVAAWNPAVNEWTTELPDGPGWRSGMSAVFAPDKGQGRIVTFGGSYKGQTKGDTWILEMASLGWIPVKPDTAPSPRRHYGMVQREQFVYLFGGQNSDGESLGDLWRFDLNNLSWAPLLLAGGPTPRRNPAFVSTTDALVLLGGMSTKNGLLDGWKLSSYPNETWSSLKEPAIPSPRQGASVTITQANGLLLYGGTAAIEDSTSPSKEVWSFQPLPTPSWTLETTDGPEVLHSATAFDPATQQLLVHGGTSNNGDEVESLSNTLWTFSDGSWATVETTGGTAPARAHHGAVWDPLSEHLLLYGGQDTTNGTPIPTNDLWRLAPEVGLWEEILTLGNGPNGMMDPALWMNTDTQQLVAVDHSTGSTRVYGLITTNWTWDHIATLPTANTENVAMGLVTASNALFISEPSAASTTWRWLNLATGQHILWSLTGPTTDSTGASFVYNSWTGDGFFLGGHDTNGNLLNAVHTLPFSCSTENPLN